MRKYWMFLILIVGIIILMPIKSYAANRVIDANEMDTFKKTKEEIQEKWIKGEINIPNGGIFEEEQSFTAPYSGGIVKQEYLNNVVDNLNYYRYLIGSPEITFTPKQCEDLQAATVIQCLSGSTGNKLTHHVYEVYSKPDDMTQEFYDLGAYAKHNIISAYNYSEPVEPFFNESCFYTTSGHRILLLNPATCNVDWGLGNVVYGRIYSSLSNYKIMSNAIAAFPSPGYFPKQDFSGGSDWDIYLNENNFSSLTTEEKSNIVVTVKNVQENKTYTYTIADKNLYIIGSIIHIYQPEAERKSYYEGDYEVYVSNLKDQNGELVDLKYTINFFDKFEGIESTISSIFYGERITRITIDKDYNAKLIDAIIPREATIELESGSLTNREILGYNIVEGTKEPYNNITHSYIPIIKDFPTWAKDTNKVLEQGLPVKIWGHEHFYNYEYTKDTFQAQEGENLTISMTYIGSYASSSNFKWYKIKNDVVEQVENGTKYQIDGTNLTITNFNENDEASYYVVNTVIFPYKDSTSPVFVSKAMTASLKPDYIKGDINNDGKVNIFDVNYGLQKLSKKNLTEDEIKRGDVTGDGKYTILDINKVLRYLSGKIKEL